MRVAYSHEVAEEIIEQRASGESLRKICKPDDMPDITTVLKWKREGGIRDHEEWLWFTTEYDLSVRWSAEIVADNVIDTAEELYEGIPDNEPYSTYIHVAKVKIDAYKWAAEKRDPARFGTHQTMVIKEEEQLSPEERDKELSELLEECNVTQKSE